MEANDLVLGSEYIYKPRDHSAKTVTRDGTLVTFVGFVPLYPGRHTDHHNGFLCAVEDNCGIVRLASPEQLKPLRMTTQAAVAVITDKLTNNPPDPEDHLGAVDRAMERLHEERELPPGPGRPTTI